MDESTEKRGHKREGAENEDPETPAKRANDRQMDNSDKENHPTGLTRSDGFGVNDYLSRLPEDDMLEIFKHLSRTDIFHLRPVNQKIYNVTHDRTLSNIKWKCGPLFIYPTDDTYCLKMRAADDCPIIDHNSQISYSYSIGKMGMSCAGIEQRTFDADEKFPRDHNIAHLDLWNVHFGHGDVKKRLAKLAKKLKKLSVSDSTELIGLNEAFIKEISEGSSLSDLTWRAPLHDENHRRAFTASPLIMQSLLRFYKLDLPTMIISSEWAAELLMLHMDTIDQPSPQHGSWRFQLDQPISRAGIVKQIRKEDYRVDDELGNFMIVRKRDGFTARFYVQDYSVMERSGTIWMLFVDFFRNST